MFMKSAPNSFPQSETQRYSNYYWRKQKKILAFYKLEQDIVCVCVWGVFFCLSIFNQSIIRVVAVRAQDIRSLHYYDCFIEFLSVFLSWGQTDVTFYRYSVFLWTKLLIRDTFQPLLFYILFINLISYVQLKLQWLLIDWKKTIWTVDSWIQSFFKHRCAKTVARSSSSLCHLFIYYFDFLWEDSFEKSTTEREDDLQQRATGGIQTLQVYLIYRRVCKVN